MPSTKEQLDQIHREKEAHKQAFPRLYRFDSLYTFCQISLVGLAIIAAIIISINVYNNDKNPHTVTDIVFHILGSVWYSWLAIGFLQLSIFTFLTSLLFNVFKVKQEVYKQFNKEREDFTKRTETITRSMKPERTKEPELVPIKIDEQWDSLSLDQQLQKVNLYLSITHNAYPNYKKIQKIIQDDFTCGLVLGFIVNLIIAISVLYNSNQDFNFWQIAIAIIICFFPGFIAAMIFGLILFYPFVYLVQFLFGIPHKTFVTVTKRLNALESQKRSIELKIQKEKQAVLDRIAYQKRQQELASQRQFETVFLGKVEIFLTDLQKKKYSVSDATTIRNSIQDDYIQIKKVGFQIHTQIYYTNRLDKIDDLIHGEVSQKGSAPIKTSTQAKSSLDSTQTLNPKTDDKKATLINNTTNFVPPPIEPKPYIPVEKQEEKTKTFVIPRSTEEKKIPVTESNPTSEIKIVPTTPKAVTPTNKEKPIPKEEEKTSAELFGTSSSEVVKQESVKTHQPKPPVKIDFAKLNEHRHNIGELGEQYIFEKELNHLISQGKINQSKEVIHVSLKSDSEGYDIVSFTDTGERKYIEVKTTTGNEFEPFYLSNSEMEAMKRLNNYWIYRVYNFNVDLKRGDLFKIDCKKEIDHHYNIQASSFKVTPKK